jgi:hypothetical protein
MKSARVLDGRVYTGRGGGCHVTWQATVAKSGEAAHTYAANDEDLRGISFGCRTWETIDRLLERDLTYLSREAVHVKAG